MGSRFASRITTGWLAVLPPCEPLHRIATSSLSAETNIPRRTNVSHSINRWTGLAKFQESLETDTERLAANAANFWPHNNGTLIGWHVLHVQDVGNSISEDVRKGPLAAGWIDGSHGRRANHSEPLQPYNPLPYIMAC